MIVKNVVLMDINVIVFFEIFIGESGLLFLLVIIIVDNYIKLVDVVGEFLKKV